MGNQSDSSNANDRMILIVSVFFPLLRLFIYFLLKSESAWVQKYIIPLLQYRKTFDFCSFVLFIVTIYIFMCRNKKQNSSLFASLLLNFINTIVCWDYVPDLWAKGQEFCSWLLFRLRISEGYVVGFGLLIFLTIVIFCWRKWEGEFLQHIKRAWDSYKKDGSCIYRLILFILGFFFLVQAVVEIGDAVGFKVSKIQRMVEHSFGVLAIISAVSMVYICVQIIRKRKNEQKDSASIIFMDVCLSLWGMASIRFYSGKLIMSGQAFRNLILAEVELFIAFAIILAGVLLWNGAVKNLRNGKGFKIFKHKDKRFRFAIYVSGFIILFLLIVLVIIFAKWGEQINRYFNRLDNQVASIKGIMEFWGIIVLFAVVGMVVLGGISLFIYEVFQAISKEEKKPSEWVVLLVSFILTGLSLYIYYKIEPEDGMNKVTEDVAGVFAFPVVLMAWYVIMTGLLANLSGFLKDQGEIKDKLQKEMKNLILDSISAIFAPLYFSANYLATLRDAVLEDSDEENRGKRGGRRCCRTCYIWLKKCFKRKGGLRR